MITQTIVNSYKKGLLEGAFNFSSTTSQVFKIALYTSAADLNANTTVYSTSNESSGTGYTAGGKVLTISTYPTLANSVAFMSFDTVTWSVTSLTARGALIYKFDGVTNPAIAVLDFGEDKTTSGGNFVINFPLADFQNAIVRSA
tara:strand:- start:307 stop:738 length:432 start_codon:yes stop_codon:yes gene_type:complete